MQADRYANYFPAVKTTNLKSTTYETFRDANYFLRTNS